MTHTEHTLTLKPHPHAKIDTKALLAGVNILDVLDADTPLKRVGATDGGEYAGPCPWCGGDDRFRVWPNHHSGHSRYWCRKCGQHGDAIDLLMDLRGVDFRQACEALSSGTLPQIEEGRQRTRVNKMSLPSVRPQNPDWEQQARAILTRCKDLLWQPVGRSALNYLRARNLEDQTIRFFELGYNPDYLELDGVAWGQEKSVVIRRGIVIPHHSPAGLQKLNVRRWAKGAGPKYMAATGSMSGLFEAGTFDYSKPTVLVEGEFDAMLIWQYAGDLVNAVATGSTTGGRRARWVYRLCATPHAYIAYDNEPAGDDAAQWWLSKLPLSTRLLPEDKDPAEMGSLVRGWILQSLHGWDEDDRYEYEERWSIAELDGHQPWRIAAALAENSQGLETELTKSMETI